MKNTRFRAWDIKHKIMEEIIDLYWFEENGVKDFNGEGLCSNYEIIQYTGLKDKNDIEIYEGDIVKINNKFYEVIWDKYKWNLKNFYCSWQDNPNDGFSEINVEIIGNIFNNPELLKE